ncbi:MAG: glycosyltransferase family 2 protein [Lentisphaeria bacterium]|nr:glycosyltransferase family 2 protein [Lentisphaeria bacterium]
MTNARKERPTVSVLIPAYNKERTICRAVRSVLAQTCRDLEVIVSDDASTDGTRDRVRELAAEDGRVRLVESERNQGTLLNRLSAFEASAGKYLLCLDADDTLDPECAAALVSLVEKESADMVGFGARMLDGSGKTAGTVDAVKHVLTGKNIFEAAFCRHLYNWSVCLKLIRRDLFEKAASEAEKFYCVSAEDFYFYTVLSHYAQRLVMSGRIFYNYHVSEGLTGECGPDSFRRLATLLDALNAVRRFLDRQGVGETYAAAFADREREHFFLLLDRFPGDAASLSVLTEKYDPAAVKRLLSEFFSPEYADGAFAALAEGRALPALPGRDRESGGKWKKLLEKLLPPESPQWFLAKRWADRVRWRKYS